LIRRQFFQRLAFPPNRSGSHWYHSHQTAEEGRFSNPVSTEKNGQLAGREIEGDIPQDVAATVILIDRTGLKHVLFPVGIDSNF
jgi:hypothetical protein